MSNANEMDLMLCGRDFREFLPLKKKIESKFKVVISAPDTFKVKFKDLIVVGFSGAEDDMCTAVNFVRTYISCEKNATFNYSKRLEPIFEDENWLNLLESLHNVLVLNRTEKKTLLIYGPAINSALSALYELSSSFTQKQQQNLNEHLTCVVSELSESVPEDLQKSMAYAINHLPYHTAKVLLLWIKRLYCIESETSPNTTITLLDDTLESANESIEILDSPVKKTVPVVTLSDDEETSEQCETNNIKRKHSEEASFSEKAVDNVAPLFIPFVNGCSTDYDRRKQRKREESDVIKEKENVPAVCVPPSPPSAADDNEIMVLPEVSNVSRLEPVVPRKLRPIVIDGSNVAREHGRSTSSFSCLGIKICVEHFLKLGHTDVTAFIPRFRRNHSETVGTEHLAELEKNQRVVYTPSRCYDDRFIVELALKKEGVIVSNDNFRDLMQEKEEWKQVIESRLLMYCFVGDIFMVPDDPLGRRGPRIDEFLSFPSS